MNLNGIWNFTYTKEAPGVAEIPAEFNGKIQLPGCWDDSPKAFENYQLNFNEEYKLMDFENPEEEPPPDASLPFISGTVWYYKELTIDSENEYAILRLGRVSMDAVIYLNGQPVDYHIGYSTNSEIVLPSLSVGINKLMIAVTNTRRDRLGCSVRGFKGYSGGVFGDVKLQLYSNPSIKDAFIYPDKDIKTLFWQVELYGEPTNMILNAKIFKDTELIEEISSSTLEFQSNVNKLKSWSDSSPELYQIEISLSHNNKLLDTYKCNFGMRRLTTDKMALKINGTPVYLRGATEHAYFAETCTPPTEKAYYIKIVSKLKSLGFNWLRFHTSIPPEEYMEACDELGVFIQAEPPVGFGLDEWRDIVRACRRHPSVVIYCAGNEELLNEAKISYLEYIAEKTKELAPDALFNPQEALRGVEYSWNFSDFGFPIKKEPFIHNPVRLKNLQSFSDVLGQYALGKMSYGSTLCNVADLNKKLEIYKLPCLTHEVCIQGTYMSLDLQSRYKNTRIGDRLYGAVRTSIENAGLLDNAENYYKKSCLWQQALRKQTLENARSCSNLSGYDLLGAIDYHWHRYGYPCGIMNEFYELKPGETVENVLSYNGLSVLLLDKNKKHCYHETESLDAKILFSCFDTDGIKNCQLEVALADALSGELVDQQCVTIDNVSCGELAKLGTFKLSYPTLHEARKYIIKASFGNYQNKWPIWVFPETPEIESKIIETENIDNALISKIENGASCILYGSGPFPSSDTLYQISVAGRAEGNLATVIYDHPIFDNFPHEEWCDWHFADMINDGKAIDLTALNMPIPPIVEMVSSFKTIKKQAMIFEIKVGKGHLIVCSMNLENSKIAGAYLKSQLQQYAEKLETGKIHAQNAFTLEPSKLQSIIENNYSSQSALTTDQGFDTLGQLKV